MPRVGMRCVVDNAEVGDAACIACRVGAPRAGVHCQFSYEMLRAMMNSGSGRGFAKISATMLTGPCARKHRLEAEVPYTVSPLQLFPGWRGTMAHKLAESTPQPGAIYERRFEAEVSVNGTEVAITGQIDKLDVVNGTIWDFKTKPDAKLRALREPDEAHVWQLNIYRYLVQRGWPQEPVEVRGRVCAGRDCVVASVHRLALVYFSMDRVVTVDAPVYELDVVEAYIAERAAAFVQDWLPQPPPGLNPMTSRLCVDWCPVRHACLNGGHPVDNRHNVG